MSYADLHLMSDNSKECLRLSLKDYKLDFIPDMSMDANISVERSPAKGQRVDICVAKI